MDHETTVANAISMCSQPLIGIFSMFLSSNNFSTALQLLRKYINNQYRQLCLTQAITSGFRSAIAKVCRHKVHIANSNPNLILNPNAQMVRFSQMRRSRSDVIKNAEHFAPIDIDRARFEKECNQYVVSCRCTISSPLSGAVLRC